MVIWRRIDGSGDCEATFGPEDVFDYIYTVFHSPSYRERYAEFLKIDFPRVPLTSDREKFRKLVRLGGDLVALHLLESPLLARPATRYPVVGDNRVEKGYPKYFAPGVVEPGSKAGDGVVLEVGRVYINRSQYFEGVPSEVWEHQVGGYQVCDKWLKDRRGRQLSYDDLTHYQMVVGAAGETDREIFDRILLEYDVLNLKRVYFSAFTPLAGTAFEDRKKAPAWREHRLYQVDWLYRVYKLAEAEIAAAFDDDGFLRNSDPKTAIARASFDEPVDPNGASFAELIRVPGIGPKSARRILLRRKNGRIERMRDLAALGVAARRAEPFLKVGGKAGTTLDRWGL